MIKLLAFVLLIVPLFGETTHFTFPDHHSRFLYFTEKSVKNSSQITIISKTFNHTALKKVLQSAAKSGSKVNLYLNTASKDPLNLIQYRGIELFLTPARLEQSFILIDKESLCTTTGEIDEARFSQSASSMHCSTDPSDIKRLNPWLKEIRSLSRPYFKE